MLQGMMFTTKMTFFPARSISQDVDVKGETGERKMGKFRKLGRTKLGVKEGRSSLRSMENKPEGEEIM